MITRINVGALWKLLSFFLLTNLSIQGSINPYLRGFGNHVIEGDFLMDDSDLARASVPTLSSNVEEVKRIYKRSLSMPYKCSNTLQKIEDPSINAESYFGDALDISGDNYVVGVPFYDDSGLGAVHVFSLIGGRFEFVQDVVGDQPTFGNDVSISGETFVVGSQYDGGNGSVSVYTLIDGNWTFIEKLVDPDGANGNLFGYSVDMTDDIIVVGSPYDDTAYSNAGAISIFNFADGVWNHMAKLTDPDGAANDFFGKSLAVSEIHIIVGSPYYDSYKGAAIIFTLSDGSWKHSGKITDPKGASMRFFAESVDIFGNTAVVGTHFHKDSGSASIYELGPIGWTQKAILTDPELVNGKVYKNSIAMSETVVVIGHPFDDGKQEDSGSVSVFGLETAGWEHVSKVTDPNGQSRDFFGNAVSISGDNVVIGAYGNGDDHGVTFIAPCIELIWGMENMQVRSFDQKEKDLSINVPVNGQPDIMTATVYRFDCRTQVQDSDTAVTLFDEEYLFPYFDFSFKAHIEVSEINDSALSYFDIDADNLTGLSRGRLMFCVKVEAIDKDSLIALASRDYLFQYQFDFTNNVIVTGFGADLPNDVGIYNQEYTFDVLACECDPSTFSCIDKPPPKLRNSNIDICLTPTIAGAKIVNFNMQISNIDSSFSYDPVSLGSDTYYPSSSTNVMEDPNGSNTLAVTAPIAAGLFVSDLDSGVKVNGNAFMELSNGKTQMALYPYELEIEVERDVIVGFFLQSFTTFFAKLFSFFRCIFRSTFFNQ